MTLYMESFCPFCKKFVKGQLKDLFDQAPGPPLNDNMPCRTGYRVASQMLPSFRHMRRTQHSVALVTSRPARAAISELLDKIDLHIEPGVFANQAKDGNWTCLHGDKECHLDRFEVPVPTLACCA